MLDDGDERGQLGVQPGEGVGLGGEDRLPRRVRLEPDELRVDPLHRGRHRVGVPGVKARTGDLALGVVGEQPPGVQAEQVVQPVAVGRVLHQHVRFEQVLQQAVGFERRQVEEGARAVGAEVVGGMQAAQPERALGGGAQVGVTELEAGEHARLAGGQLGEPAVVVVQPPGQVADGPRLPGGQPRARDAQRERQPGARLGERADRAGIGLDPVRSRGRGDQGDRFLRAERFEVDGVRAGQAGHPAPAGHDQVAAAGSGQQRQHLAGVVRVVQQHQHPPVGELAPEHRGRLCLVGPDPPARHAERAQEAAEHPHRLRPGRGGAAQIGVQLTIGIFPA